MRHSSTSDSTATNKIQEICFSISLVVSTVVTFTIADYSLGIESLPV
jgi:hypothetical protein